MAKPGKTYKEIWEYADKNNARYLDYSRYSFNKNNEFDIDDDRYKVITYEKKKYAKECLESAGNNWNVMQELLTEIGASPGLMSNFEKILSPYKTNRLYAVYYSGGNVNFEKIIDDIASNRDVNEILHCLNDQVNAMAANGICSLMYNEFYFKTGTKMMIDNKNTDNIIKELNKKFQNGDLLIPSDLNDGFKFIEDAVSSIRLNRNVKGKDSDKILLTCYNKFLTQHKQSYENPNPNPALKR